MTRAVRCGALALVLTVTGCGHGRYDGRLEGHAPLESEELARSARAVAEYRRRVRSSTDAAATARLARVAAKLVEAAKAGPGGARASTLPWEIELVESPDMNVATFPNGAIFVEAGLLRVLATDDALAGAIAQAMARALLRHGGEVTSVRAAGQQAFEMTGFGGGPSRSDIATRQAEEADFVGLMLAVDAGYDPDLAVVLFDLLGLRERGREARERLPELRAQRERRPGSGADASTGR